MKSLATFVICLLILSIFECSLLRNRLTTSIALTKKEASKISYNGIYHIKQYRTNLCLSASKGSTSIKSSFCDRDDLYQRFEISSDSKKLQMIKNVKLGSYLRLSSVLYLSKNKIREFQMTKNSGYLKLYSTKIKKCVGGASDTSNSFKAISCSNTDIKRENTFIPAKIRSYRVMKTTPSIPYKSPVVIRMRSKINKKQQCLSIYSNAVRYKTCKLTDKSQQFNLSYRENTIRFYQNSSKLAITTKGMSENNEAFFKVSKESESTFQRFYVTRYSKYFIFKSVATKKCMRFRKNDPIQHFSCYQKDDLQQFEIVRVNEFKKVGVSLSKWKVLTDQSGKNCLTATGENDKVTTEKCRSDSKQVWKVSNSGNTFSLYNKRYKKYLEKNENGLKLSNSKRKFNIDKFNGGYRFINDNKCVKSEGDNQRANFNYCVKDKGEKWKLLSAPKTDSENGLPFNTWFIIRNKYYNKCVTSYFGDSYAYSATCKPHSDYQQWKVVYDKTRKKIILRNKGDATRTLFYYANNVYDYLHFTSNTNYRPVHPLKFNGLKKNTFLIGDGKKCLYVYNGSSQYNLKYSNCSYLNIKQQFTFEEAKKLPRPSKIYLNRWMMISRPDNKYCFYFNGTNLITYACNRKSKLQHFKFIYDEKADRVRILNRHYQKYVYVYNPNTYLYGQAIQLYKPSSSSEAFKSQLFRIQEKKDYIKIIDTRGRCVHETPNSYSKLIQCIDTNTHQRFYPIPLQPYVDYNNYRPRIEAEVPGTIRVFGKCLTYYGNNKEPQFRTCLPSGKNSSQMFIMIKKGSYDDYIISTPDYKSSLISDSTDMGQFKRFMFIDKVKNTFRVTIKKFGYFTLKENRTKKCIVAPGDKKQTPLLTECGAIQQLGRFMYIKKGYSPEENKLRNNIYRKRNEIALFGENQIVSLKGLCIKKENNNKPVDLAECNDKDYSYFFEFIKTNKRDIYNIATHSKSLSIKDKQLFEDKKGNKVEFRVKRREGSYQIRSADNRDCLTVESDDLGSSLKMNKCKSSNLNQVFAIVGYNEYYDY